MNSLELVEKVNTSENPPLCRLLLKDTLINLNKFYREWELGFILTPDYDEKIKSVKSLYIQNLYGIHSDNDQNSFVVQMAAIENQNLPFIEKIKMMITYSYMYENVGLKPSSYTNEQAVIISRVFANADCETINKCWKGEIPRRHARPNQKKKLLVE